MNIVYVSNEKYVPHLAASLCSVAENNRSEDVLDFYIISTGISDASLKKLAALCDSYGRKMYVSDLSNIRDRIASENPVFIRKFDISILGRFFLSELLPTDLDKVLYLDCDTITTASLHEIYTLLPEEGKILAAVMEPTIYKSTKDMLGMGVNDPYFNSGVLLIDLKAWRSFEADRRLREYYESISASSVFADQDAINGLFRGYIKSLDPKYNFFTNYRYFGYKTLLGISPAYAAVSADEYAYAQQHPVIIHYAGDERPWIRGNRNPFRDEYKNYLRKTEWRNTPDEPGKDTYMLMYHLMNVSTSVCPPVRKAISDVYSKKLSKK